MDRIDVMRLFIRVADTGNFSKVARASGISQPTVSKTIAALETKLGAQLLRRTSRSLSLTVAGQDFYEAAAGIIEQVESAESRIGKGEASPAGLVRVALSPGFGRLHILPHLPQFFARYPDVTIDFDISQRYVNLIEGGLDLAVRIGSPSDSTLIARRIGSAEYLTAAAPDYLARFGTPLTPGDLKTHRCIAFMSHDAPRPWLFAGPGGPIEHLPQGPVRSNDADYIRAAVLSGLGIGHNPSWLYAGDVAKGAMVRVLADYVPAPFPISAVWAGSRRLPGKTRVFIDFLAEIFDANPLLKIR